MPDYKVCGAIGRIPGFFGGSALPACDAVTFVGLLLFKDADPAAA
jgi:hypothetical protein